MKKSSKKFLNYDIERVLNRLKNLTKKELSETLENDVFEQPEFKRHMKELAISENISEEEANKVIKHYLLTVGKEALRITKHRRRIVLFGFMHIDIQEIIYNEHSIYYKYKNKKNE